MGEIAVQNNQSATNSLEYSVKPNLFDYGAIRREKLKLPENPEQYSDKYFVRSHEILQAEGLNPWVRAQVFFRGGPGEVYGVNEAIAILDHFCEVTKNGGSIRTLPEGGSFSPKESVMVIEAPVQSLIKFETLYLGVLAAATTAANLGAQTVKLEQVTERCRVLKALVGDRPIILMSARHWRWQEDSAIAAAAFRGGVSESSTDIGAATAGKTGVGTIPHVLETVYAWKHGRDEAVRAATLAFDRIIGPAVPRVALIDFNNREIDDTLATATALGSHLKAVRVDTCGENVAQGGLASLEELNNSLLGSLPIPEQDLKYWCGRGVTISGVLAIRNALDDAGFSGVNIILSSGFANPRKVGAFVRAEKILRDAGLLKGQLFDSIGAGGVFEPCWHTTMDIVAVAEHREDLDTSPMGKVGRLYRPNDRLVSYEG